MIERRALIAGINDYDSPGLGLKAAANDAAAVSDLLQHHADGERNYDCRLLISTPERKVGQSTLRLQLEQLFDPGFDGDALFYFSGHGAVTRSGGWLLCSEARPGDLGLRMEEVMRMANLSPARNILVLLDCCHAGAMAGASDDALQPVPAMRENMTVVAAVRSAELASEQGPSGEFTRGLLDALRGGAADLVGDVTPSAIFRCMERRSGSWDRRPLYRAHSSRSFVVRRCPPVLEKSTLRRLAELFPAPDARYALDPEYEPEDASGDLRAPVNEAKLRITALLKRYRDAGLVRPTLEGEQLYWTARHGHSVELTAAGREWWYLARDRRI